MQALLQGVGNFLYGKRKPRPRCLSIFFSNFQKKWNWPKIHPKKTNRIWYSGKMRSRRTGQYTQPEVSFLCRPTRSVRGAASSAEQNPVRAKTMQMMMIWGLECMPQRFFSFSMMFMFKIILSLYCWGKQFSGFFISKGVSPSFTYSYSYKVKEIVPSLIPCMAL